jgi:hypothetical protein
MFDQNRQKGRRVCAYLMCWNCLENQCCRKQGLDLLLVRGRSLFLCGAQCCVCLGHQVCWLCGARACLRGAQLWSICTTLFSVQSQFLREKGFFKVLKYNNQRK